MFAVTCSLLALGVSAVMSPVKPDETVEIQAQSAADDVFMIDCANLPQVCINDCYGAFCTSTGVKLTYDDPDDNVKEMRRHNAGCGGSPNRCSGLTGKDCDEYPYQVTFKPGGVAVRVSRCINNSQNRSEGSKLKGYLNGPHCQGATKCTFSVGFENADDIKYCKVQDGKRDCELDDNEEIGPNDMGRLTDTTPSSRRQRYRLASGKIMLSASGLSVGTPVTSVVPINETLYNEQISSDPATGTFGSRQYDFQDNLRLVQDSITDLV